MSTETLVSAAFTFMLFSFVFAKDNPIYNFAEHVFVAVGAGHAVTMALRVLRMNAWDQLLKGKTIIIVPIIFGLLLFTRYFKGLSWLTRPSLALVVACGAGLGLRGAIRADFLDQIVASFLPLNSLNNIIFMVGVVTTITYFFFTKHYTKTFESGPMSFLPTVGQWFMMIAFGASFGQAAMGRLAILVGKMQFILKDLLRIGA